MKTRLVLVLAALPLGAAPPNPSCDRDCLFTVSTEYFDAMIAHRPSVLRVTDNFRFTENAVEMKLPQSPLWQNASRLRPYRLDILDVREGVAASQAIVEEAGKAVMVSTRLKVVSGKISEAETQVTRNREEGALFEPDSLKAPSGAMLWRPPDVERNSRDQMIRIAELYPAGLKAGSFITVDVPFADGTYRLENGRLMAGPGCTFLPGCDNIKTQKVPTLSGITPRVVAVDEELGIVLLRMDFGAGSTRTKGDSLIAWEGFKIYGGKIHAVEAFMRVMPLGTPSGWDSPASK
jgi:hypothetical protein